MIAFLLAGLILGVLARTLLGGFGAPQVLVTCLTGVVGAIAGGVGMNLVLSNDLTGMDVWSFSAAVLVALVLLGLLEGGVGRKSRG